MSELMKKHPTSKVDIVIGKTEYQIPKSQLRPILSLVKKYEVKTTTVPWRNLAINEIEKYGEQGVLLKGLRNHAGLTQAELANKIGIKQYNLSKMENGKRPIGKEMAKKLASTLKVNYKVFL